MTKCDKTKKLCKVKQRRVHSTHHKHIRFVVTNANIFSRCARARHNNKLNNLENASKASTYH